MSPSVLRIMDDNRDKRISPLELKYGLKDYGLNLTDQQLQDVMAYFDKDKVGRVYHTIVRIGSRLIVI